jgi:hypothetical protein
MKKHSLLLVLALFFTTIAFSQKKWSVPASPNKAALYKGDLADGAVIEDLSWASTSSNACWPATENTYFRGNHVFFVSSIPPNAELTVTVIPDDVNTNLSIYGFQLGTNTTNFPPDISSCVACESERKWDRPKVGKTQDHTRSIYFNSTTDSYRVVIGVAGADGLKTGTFNIKFDLKADEADNSVQEPVIAKKINLTGTVTSISGNLNQGVKINDLSWASTSSMACWPATQNTKFRGNHVLYTHEMQTNLNYKITVIPKDVNANFSLYTIQDGIGQTSLPPDIRTCTSCEAEHKWDYKKAGKTQDHTRVIQIDSFQGPWRLVIGVSAADGLTTGDYTLKIETSPM